MVFVIPSVALLIGLGIGWPLLRYNQSRVAAVLAALLVGGIGWMYYQQEAAQGYDALAWALGWALFLLPTLVGLGLGASIGRWRRLRRSAEARSEAA